MSWQDGALWGLLGALCTRALVFIEANKRAKGPAWQYPEGPGAGYFVLATALHAFVGAVAGAALVASHVMSLPFLVVGAGATAPVVLKKLGRYALEALESAGKGSAGNEKGGDGEDEDDAAS